MVGDTTGDLQQALNIWRLIKEVANELVMSLGGLQPIIMPWGAITAPVTSSTHQRYFVRRLPPPKPRWIPRGFLTREC